MGKEKNSYEEARRQRVQENLKQLQCLGISKISKSLQEAVKGEKLLKIHASPKAKKILETTEVRRSGRARNPVSSYIDMFQDDDIERRHYRRRIGYRSSNAKEHNGRVASYKQRIRAIEKAETLQDDLKSNNPSFVKSMVRSHVSSCFWLGLPSSFCKEHLPEHELKMVLEDENGVESGAIYIGSRAGLSGGWRGFSVDHGLEDGDALVFELSKPDRFKVYIVRAIEDNEEQPSQDHNNSSSDDMDNEDTSQPPKRKKRSSEKKRVVPVSKKPLARKAKRNAK